MLINVSEKISAIHVGIDFGTTYSLVCNYSENNFEFVKFSNNEILLPSIIDNTYKFGTDNNKTQSIKRLIASINATNMNDNIYFVNDFTLITDIAIDFFKRLRIEANQYFNANVKLAVLSLPARFNQIQRQIVCKAAQKAGWEILDILTEPAAAAIGEIYENDGIHVVYDLGGGTVDISLIRITGANIHVLKTNGDLFIGGEHILELSKQIGTKKALDNMIPKTITMITDMLTEYDHMIRINSILCVGGAVKMALPYLRKLRKKLIISAEPSLSVAKGLARYISSSYLRLIEVAAFDIGVKMLGGGIEYLIKRDMPLPAIGRCIFTNAHPNQTCIEFTLIQDGQDLSTFDVPIASGHIGSVQIDVQCVLQQNSMIELRAVNLQTDFKIDLEFKALK